MRPLARKPVVLNAVLISALCFNMFLFSCKHSSGSQAASGRSETTTAATAATSRAESQPNAADVLPNTSQTEEGLGVLVLPDGSRFKTTLYELKVIGQLKTTRKLPYYILSGQSCPKGCDANTSIYIHSPSDGPMKDSSAQRRFFYPGLETYYKDDTPIYQARMFYGDCAGGHPNAALWFQRFFGDDKQWHPSVFAAWVTGDVLTSDELHGAVPDIKEAEQAVRAGRCREVPGIDRTSEP